MALSTAQPLYMMSAVQPWAYLMANGFKKCENRDGIVPKDCVGGYTLLHVTKCRTAATRYQAYHQSEVQNYLRNIPETKEICDDDQALDDFFDQSIKSVIAIVKIESVLEKHKMDGKERAEQRLKYPFWDVGRKTNRKVILGESYLLPNPIRDVKGALGIRVVTDADLLRKVHKYMQEIDGNIEKTQQEQDAAQEEHEEEEKAPDISDDDDGVCPDFDGAVTPTHTSTFVIIFNKFIYFSCLEVQ